MISDQVSTCSHEDTAIVLVKDVVPTQLRLQLKLDTRFSLSISLQLLVHTGDQKNVLGPLLECHSWAQIC